MPTSRTLPFAALPALLLFALAAAAAAEAPRFDASCLADPRSCLQGAAGERPVAGPDAAADPSGAEARRSEPAEGPLVLTLERVRPLESEEAGTGPLPPEPTRGERAAEPMPTPGRVDESRSRGDAEAAPAGSPEERGAVPLGRADCVETSVRAGNALAESQRVCGAVFPEPGD